MSLALALYFLFVHVSLLLPGYVFVRKLKYFSKNPGIELCLAYASSLVFFALVSTLAYVFKINPVVPRALLWLVLLSTLFMFVKNKLYKNLYAPCFPLIGFFVMSLFSLAFIGLSFNAPKTYVPDPEPTAGQHYSAFNVKVLNVAQTQANDNYIPYRQAQFFVNRDDPAKDSFISEWGVNFFVRTPLMGAVTANYFNLLGDKPPIGYIWAADSTDRGHTYLKFQVLAQILNSLLVVPAYFILTRLFNQKVAAISSIFIITSQFFLYNSFFSWPKSLVAFFILVSWLLLLEGRRSYTFLAGVVSGFAYLTHDLAVLYIGASFIFLLLSKRFRELLIFTIPAFILALPWLITASLVYKKPSNFIYYPISTGGIPQLDQKRALIHNFFHTSPIKLIKIRLENIFYLFSPFQLLTSEGGQAAARRIWTVGLYSIPGAVGFGLIIPMYLAIIQKLRSLALWAFVFVPVLLCAVVIGWPKGLGALHFAEALVVLLIGYSVAYLGKLKRKVWLLVAYVVNSLQLVFFVGYSYKFAVGSWFSQPQDVLRLIVLLGVVTFGGWQILRLSRQAKTPSALY